MPMKCPACGHAMQEKRAGKVTVDVCDGGCGGIWFDRFEFQKVDEAHESAGESLLEVRRSAERPVGLQEKRHCPRCGDVVLMRHFLSSKRQVEVDECGRCAGIWLDAGELGAIRRQYATDEERRRATEAYFDEVFGESLQRLQAESAEKRDSARRFARAFRFLCPSYYIPGKQRWGAF
ncbi:MAG: hypothetical protein GF355_06925 [Candidatus Eisenbacteria bacterium]|nr:hypothetical protein [Candidatus Eisenbacteria bacterium]